MIGWLIGSAVGLGFLIWLGREKSPGAEGGDVGLGDKNAAAKPSSPPPAMPRRRPVQQFPARRPWTRKEDLAVLYLQRLGTEGRLTATHVDDLAAGTGRSEASIKMRIGNFDALDPSVLSSGLSHTAQLTREIWDEYQHEPESVFDRGKRAYLSLINRF